ncbi:MAG TPA: 23S rRNA (guanosine(2251)-2'-O)-methyltransferase RlmB [Myxococcota bacterium]|jgi:23S rRNA (guanosine2251-2'-O)-methyltransferase
MNSPIKSPRHQPKQKPKPRSGAPFPSGRGTHSQPRPAHPARKGSSSDSESTVVGRHPVLAVLKHQRDRARRLWAVKDGPADVLEAARSAGIEVKHATPDELAGRAPAGVPHQGFVLECGPFPYADLESFTEVPDITLVLDGVEDPRNFGAAARAAFALGAELLVVPGERAAPCSASAYKASAGALAQIPVARAGNLRRALEQLQQKGAWLVGAEADGQQAPWSVDMKGKIVLVIGGEDRGLRRLTREACDHVVSIPMSDPQMSLNAADAATILLYEARRQRSS